MRKQGYRGIKKARREAFGAIIFNEKPGFMQYVNDAYADAYHIEKNSDAIYCSHVFTALLDAHFAVTTRCNMYCKGCYNTRKDDEPNDVRIETAMAVLDNLSRLGVFSVSFGGGEPFLHPDIFEIAGYTRKKNMLPNITTNGLIMTEAIAQKCSVFGNVHFSVHSLQDISHVMNAVTIYRKSTGKNPGLNLLLTAETLPFADQIVNTAAKSGIKTVLFMRYKKTAKNSETTSLDIEGCTNDLPDLFAAIQHSHRRIKFLFDCSLFEVLVQNNFSSLKRYEKFDNNGCMGGNAYIAIDVAGRYKPCSFWGETMGDAATLDFHEWIYNENLVDFRNMRRDCTCTQCEFEKLCMGGCRLLY